MTTMYVAYAGDARTRFDRDYYVRTHLPLVMEAWRPHGLDSAAAFFPSGDGAGTIAVCICEFRDETALSAAFGSPLTGRVMADVKQFTDAEPLRTRAMPF